MKFRIVLKAQIPQGAIGNLSAALSYKLEQSHTVTGFSVTVNAMGPAGTSEALVDVTVQDSDTFVEGETFEQIAAAVTDALDIDAVTVRDRFDERTTYRTTAALEAA